jgi:hypothetical protein
VHTPPATTVAARTAVGCLCLAIVLGPLALGGTATWSRLGLEAAMAGAIVCWAATGPRRVKLLALPLGITALACIQIVPLPDWLVRVVAPVSAAEWREAATATDTLLAWHTISVDPAATAAGIRRLFLGLGTIAVVRDLARHGPLRGWLVAALATAGIAIWASGLAFPVDSNERVLLGCIDLKGPITFWKSPLDEPVQSAGTSFTDTVRVAGLEYQADGWTVGDGFGSYVSSNHFAGGLELTLPFACAALLAGWRSRRLPDWLGLILVAALVAAGCFTTYRLASSRAGGGSLLLGGLVLLALVAERGWPRRLALTALLGYAVLLALFLAAFFGPWLGLEQLVPEGWQPTLRGLRGDGRVVASRVAGWILAGSPLFGTGLDTFGEMQPRYLEGRSFLHYAHNDYAQLLAETGLMGVGLGLALAAVLVNRARRWAGAATGPWRTLDAAAWAALAALALHSAFDWNLHVPANGLLACVVVGLALSAGNVGGGAVRAGMGRGEAVAAGNVGGDQTSSGIVVRLMTPITTTPPDSRPGLVSTGRAHPLTPPPHPIEAPDGSPGVRTRRLTNRPTTNPQDSRSPTTLHLHDPIPTSTPTLHPHDPDPTSPTTLHLHDPDPTTPPTLHLHDPDPTPPTRPLLTIAVMLAALISLALLARDAATTHTRRHLAAAITTARLAAAQEKPTDIDVAARLTAAITRGARAARLDPGDARLAVLLGQAHLHRAALASTPHAADTPDTPDTPADVREALTWFRTARLRCPPARGLPVGAFGPQARVLGSPHAQSETRASLCTALDLAGQPVR